MPQLSTLNADVIPSSSFLAAVEQHQPKVSPDLIKQIWESEGLSVSDGRILTAASVMMEAQMLKIISEMKQVAPVQRSNFSFEELQKAMSEFGVSLKRPAFISEKAA